MQTTSQSEARAPGSPAGPPASAEAKGAIVLGSGRSGTSAVTRSLVAAGFYAGTEKQLLGPAPSNPVGHYEPLPVLELNEALLEEHGSAWWAEAPPAFSEQARDDARARVSKVIDELLEGSEGAPIVIKEPRINGLLDLWGPISDGLLHPVLVVRNPVEVAFSLANRDGTSVAHALAVWELQTIAALRWVDGKEMTVAHFDRLTSSPEAATELSRDIAAKIEPARAERINPDLAATALDPTLRNERGNEVDQAEFLTARQRELWEFLAALPGGQQRLDVPEHLRREPVAAKLSVGTEGDRFRLLAEKQAIAEEAAALAVGKHEIHKEAAAWEAEVKRLTVEVAALGGDKHRLESRLAGTEEEVQRLRAERVALEAMLGEVLQSLSWRATKPLRTLRHGVSRNSAPASNGRD